MNEPRELASLIAEMAQSAQRENRIVMTAEEQLEFWIAINSIAQPTEQQRRLGRMIRGEE